MNLHWIKKKKKQQMCICRKTEAAKPDEKEDTIVIKEVEWLEYNLNSQS